MMNVGKSADLAVMYAFPLDVVEASAQARANEVFAIGENYVEAEFLVNGHLAVPSHDPSDDSAKGFENGPFRIVTVQRKDQPENKLAVSPAFDGLAVLRMQGR